MSEDNGANSATGLQKVDVSKLAKAVYIIKVMNGEEPVTAKFVKQ